MKALADAVAKRQAAASMRARPIAPLGVDPGIDVMAETASAAKLWRPTNIVMLARTSISIVKGRGAVTTATREAAAVDDDSF
jgi:hypothetical protein